MRKIIAVLIVFASLFLIRCSIDQRDAFYPGEFQLEDVTLLEGPFKHARDLNIETLIKYDVDRLLAPFLIEAGLPPKGELYPNWKGLDGHIAGHYLTAMAMTAAWPGGVSPNDVSNTGDKTPGEKT